MQAPPISLQSLHPPKTVAEFIELADQPDVDLDALADVIAKAPDLTAGVLRLANSSTNASQNKTHLVSTAVKRLGVRRSRMAVISVALQAALQNLGEGDIDGSVVLAESQRRASFARITARAIGVDGDYAYVAGMLQDLLLPFLKLQYPGEYAAIAESGESLAAAERNVFQWDHGLVAAQLLTTWNFPEEVIVCVACHHEVETLLADLNAPRSVITAAMAAATLPDLFRQEPKGVQHLLKLQKLIAGFDFLQIAAQTDEELEASGDSHPVTSTSLSDELQRLAVESVEEQRQQTDWTGTQLSRYLVEGKLGKGAMGVVYRARHTLLRRPAAIKFMNSQNFDAMAIKRFEREAQATSQLQSPHTVQVYDYGTTVNGVMYYVMEYLEGMTLRELVQQYGPQPEGRVIHILCQICGSLSEAHAKGLIHRDIKPENISLCESSGVRDFAKVMDFGLVQSFRGNTQHAERNCLVGTPHYMSPESIINPGRIDHRTDIYALGAVGILPIDGAASVSVDDDPAGTGSTPAPFSHVSVKPLGATGLRRSREGDSQLPRQVPGQPSDVGSTFGGKLDGLQEC